MQLAGQSSHRSFVLACAQGRAGPLLLLCMYIFQEYARTRTTDGDNKQNTHEKAFSKFFVLVITRYCSHFCLPRVRPRPHENDCKRKR